MVSSCASWPVDTATIEPSDRFTIDFEIDFSDAAIGHQEKSLDMANGAFVRELCDSRTFCRKADIDMMRAAGKMLRDFGKRTPVTSSPASSVNVINITFRFGCDSPSEGMR